MLIRVDAATEASLEVVRGAVGARSAAEVVRLLVRLAEREIPFATRPIAIWPLEGGELTIDHPGDGSIIVHGAYGAGVLAQTRALRASDATARAARRGSPRAKGRP